MPQLLLAGRFEIADLTRDVIGQGAMGTVYRGLDRQTGLAVAIKALRPEITLHRPELVTRFRREGEALRQLNHPNIVTIIVDLHENGQHYLIMEFAGGQSLADLLKKGPLPVAQAVSICLDLADALTRAHRLGIIHRDLKPANVLLAEDGTPKLSDFGVAHFSDKPSLTEAGLLVGTFDYLSPEACQGQPLDERSDIWGLGVILFEMLTARRPFSGQHIADTLQAILTEPTPSLTAYCPTAPDSLSDLVYRMLEKERQARLPSTRLVGLELENILIELTGRTPTGRRRATPVTPLTAMEPGPAAAPPIPLAAHVQHNLPAQSTPFVGREIELAEVHRLLHDPANRLITILGPGGGGKTRLALELAGRLANLESQTPVPDRPALNQPVPWSDLHFRSIYFTSLAALIDPADIPATIAASVRLPLEEGGSDPVAQLAAFLSGGSTLLVLDNYEHLLDGAPLVIDLLALAPNLTILTTTRIRLNLTGETVFYLGGMDFPDWETPEDAMAYSAVQLFLQSARRVRPGFELGAGDLKYVARICRLSQGLPLAILLAAAWINALSLEEIAEEIGRGLDFLTSNIRDLPERHHSIRAVFNSSWQLLDPDSRETFMRLSVFRAGFSRKAGQQVSGASLQTLLGLVNNSLLVRQGDGRFLIHELLRQYAADMLAESGQTVAIQDAHCTYYAAALERRLPDLIGRRLPEALNDIALDFENVRAAWLWAVQQRLYSAIGQMTEALYWYMVMHSRYVEGDALFRQAFDELAPQPGEAPDQAWNRLLIFYRIFANDPRDVTLQRLRQGIQAAQEQNDRPWLVLGLQHLANFVIYSSQAEADAAIKAEEYYLASLAKSDGLPFYQAHTRYWLGNFYMNQFRWSDGRQQLQQSIDLCRELGHIGLTADGLSTLAFFSSFYGRYRDARIYVEESNDYRSQMGDWAGIAICRSSLAHLYLLEGDLDRANEWALASLEAYTGSGFQIIPLLDNAVLAAIALVKGDHEEAARLAEKSLGYSGNLSGYYEALAQLVMAGVAAARHEEDKAIEILTKHLAASVAFQEESAPDAETKESWAVLMQQLPLYIKLLDHLGHQRLAIELLTFCRQHPAALPAWWRHFDWLPAVEASLRQAISPESEPDLWQVPVERTYLEVLQALYGHFSPAVAQPDTGIQ
jgi:serine/threonine protein kinase